MSKATKWYVRVRRPEHPRADAQGKVRRSVLVLEEYLNRFLLPDEEPHHINGIKTDDRKENLEVVIHSEHSREHRRRENNLARYNSEPRNTKGRPFYGNQYIRLAPMPQAEGTLEKG